MPLEMNVFWPLRSQLIAVLAGGGADALQIAAGAGFGHGQRADEFTGGESG